MDSIKDQVWDDDQLDRIDDLETALVEIKEEFHDMIDSGELTTTTPPHQHSAFEHWDR